MKNVWNFLSNLSLIYWIIWILLLIISFVIYFWKWCKLQWRFWKNLKRKIYFLEVSNSKDLQLLKDQIKNLGLLDIDEDIKDISKNLNILQTLKDNAIFIVRYNEWYSNYKELLEEAKNNKIPVIIYAKQGEIKNSKHWEIFNSYIFCDVANTSNRLVIILLNILKIV